MSKFTEYATILIVLALAIVALAYALIKWGWWPQ